MSPHANDIRPAIPADLPFLRDMLYEAIHWRPDDPRPPIEETLAAPDLAKLLADWGRPGDAGVLAEGCDDSEKWGAAWYRLWTEDDHAYGYVAPEIPEIGIGVKQGHRRQGIGRALLKALIQRARADAFPALSLSVENANPAQYLYQSLGFKTVQKLDTATTMLLQFD